MLGSKGCILVHVAAAMWQQQCNVVGGGVGFFG
jgi:hypothetical protein